MEDADASSISITEILWNLVATATTTATTATAESAAATSTAAASIFTGTCFIDCQGATIELSPVKGFDSSIGLCTARHFDKAKALGSAGITVHNDTR